MGVVSQTAVTPVRTGSGRRKVNNWNLDYKISAWGRAGVTGWCNPNKLEAVQNRTGSGWLFLIKGKVNNQNLDYKNFGLGQGRCNDYKKARSWTKQNSQKYIRFIIAQCISCGILAWGRAGVTVTKRQEAGQNRIVRNIYGSLSLSVYPVVFWLGVGVV